MFAEESVLAAVMLSAVAIADGFAPSPEGATVFHRSPLGGWSVRRPFRVAGRWSWMWRPFVWTSVVCDASASVAAAQSPESRAIARRWRRLASRVTLMQALAAIQTAALIAGLPAAAVAYGVIGLLLGVATVLYLGMLQGLLAGPVVWRLTGSWRAGVSAAVRCLWPFASLRAADAVIRAMSIDGPTVVRIAGDGVILEAYRASLYDAVSGSDSPEGDYWLGVLGRDRVTAFLGRSPGANACPRCNCQYRADQSECADCGIALR